MRKWTRRWISAAEINDRRKWKKAWAENPEKMKLAQAKATLAAKHNKERRRQKLIELFLGYNYPAGIETSTLNVHLAQILKSNRYKPTRAKVKATRMRLIRYGILSFDPADGLWKVKVA